MTTKHLTAIVSAVLSCLMGAGGGLRSAVNDSKLSPTDFPARQWNQHQQ